MGKEAGLFLPSGTMGNLAAILAYCGRGDEAIVGDKSHTFLYEAGGISALGGVHSCQLPNQPDGTMRLTDIEAAVREDDEHEPVTRLICLENTHNRCGGVALTPEYTRAVGDFAHSQGLSLHIDGARIFNAAVGLGVPVRELVDAADSVTFCLSKSLCAPVGSVLCGSKAFIQRAHRIRKQLGGGMRQAGILAAAGIAALDTMVDQLAKDHLQAKKLAEGLGAIPGILLEPGTPYTNMVYISLEQGIATETVQRLMEYDVRAGVAGATSLRLVTHYWIDDQAIEQTIEAFRKIMAKETVYA